MVLLKLNEEIVKKTIVPDSTIQKIEHKQLRINTYSIELIKDDDGNGEWTTGDYWLKRQPEALKTFDLEKLREDWDLEAKVFWNEPVLMQRDSSNVIPDSTSMNLGTKNIDKKKRAPRSGNPRDRIKDKPDPKGKND